MHVKLISTLIAIALVTGCTSMKPVELSADQLQEGISAGEVIHDGDTVKIVTADGETHKFEVTAITNENIIGNNIEVPIVNIVAVELREHSDGKSGALSVGVIAVVVLVLTAAATGL